MLESLEVTNSDDLTYGLFTLYIKHENGSYFAYEDKACTKKWIYSELEWELESVASIDTPDVLLQMYADYTSGDVPLVWTGAKDTWTATGHRSTGDALPGDDTGWDVQLAGSYFHSFADDTRKVLFDDHSTSGEVQVKGQVSTPEMLLANETLSYSFDGTNAATIKAERFDKTGRGKAAFSNVGLAGNSAVIQRGMVSLGTGSQMTYSSAELKQESSLQFNGGSAQFKTLTLGSFSSLDIASDSTLAADVFNCASQVVFNFSTAGALLTFDGSLQADAPIRIEYTGTGTAGNTYALMQCVDGLSGWSDLFYTGYGTLSFNNNTLYLNYSPIRQNICGTNFTDMSSALDKSLLIFDGAAAGNIAVNGLVAPQSIRITAGTYYWVNGTSAGQVQVADSITLSGSATLYSRLSSLGGNQIILNDTSRLYLETPGENRISYLKAAPGSAVRVQSGTTTFENVIEMGALEVGDSAKAVFSNAWNMEMAGNVTGGGALQFTNGGVAECVMYYLSGEDVELRNVTIGSSDSPLSNRVSLALPGDIDGSFNILADGELLMLGDGAFSAQATGRGRLSVAENAVISFSVVDDKPTFDETLDMDVRGLALMGDANHLLLGKMASDVTVSGYLMVAGATGDISIGALTLNGGWVCFDNYYASEYGVKPYGRNIASLVAGEAGGTLISRSDQGYSQLKATIDIASFSGTGNVTMQGESAYNLNLFRIASLAASGYTGTLTVLHNNRSYSSCDQATVVELKDMKMEGSVSVQTLRPSSSADSNAKFITALGIDGDVSMAGLDSTKDPVTRVYLYSGHIKPDTTTLNHYKEFSTYIDAVEHTLTLDSDDDHHFAGTVYQSLNLVKKGKGKQVFAGEMEDFDGAIDVQGGTLLVKDSFSASSVKVSNSALLSENSISTVSGMTLSNGVVQASLVNSGSASFTGCNKILADQVTGDTWTLNISSANEEQAVVTLSGALTLSGIGVEYASDDLYAGDYILLRSAGDISITSMLENTSLVTESIDGVEYTSLIFTLQGGIQLLPRTEAATLTWQADSGIWAEGKGHSENLWSASVDNRNFFAGDTVVFNQAATVTLHGTLKPDTVTVNHRSGEVLFSGSGHIDGDASLTKSGAGELTIDTANTYTGGTTISGGVVNMGHVSALGTGTIEM